MFNCPKCGGLSPIGTTVCGACGTNLENVPGNVSKNEKKDSGVILYDRDFASPTDANKVKNKYAFISPWHIIMFVASVCSYIFIPNRLIKLVIAFVFFYISNRKNSAFLVLVRIVTALQILGIVIALLLRLTTSSEIMNEFFKYFKF